MSVPHIFLSYWLSVCQKLSNLMKISRSSDKNKFGLFLAHPVYEFVECLRLGSCRVVSWPDGMRGI